MASPCQPKRCPPAKKCSKFEMVPAKKMVKRCLEYEENPEYKAPKKERKKRLPSGPVIVKPIQVDKLKAEYEAKHPPSGPKIVKPIQVDKLKAEYEAKGQGLIPPLQRGQLSQFGYHNVADLSTRQRHSDLKKALNYFTPLELFHKLNAIYVLNKNNDKGSIFLKDRNWIRKNYMKE